MNDEPKEPLAEEAKAPAKARYAGAALFILAAVAGISTIRACRQPGGGSSPAPVSPAQETPKSAP